MTMRAIVVASLLVLAGCGGGGGTTPSTGSGANGGSPSGGGSSSSGSIRFVIPNKGSSGASSSRGPAYVSPSSVSLKVTINSIGGNTSIPSSIPNPQTTNLTTTGTNPPCAINAGVETCTVPIPVPTGSVSYTFDLYDATGATGNHLATATQTLTNVAGTNPPVSVGLSGIVAKVAVTGTPAFQLETAASQQLSIVPEDADDNPITGSALYYSGSLLITDNDTSGTTGLTLGSASTLPAVGASSVTVTSGANDVIYLNYNGAASSDPNFTVSSKFNGPTTIDGSPVSVSLAAFSQQSNNTYTGGSTVTFPPAGGFSGTLNLGTPVTAASGNVKAVTTAAAPTEGAPLAFMRKAAAAVRHTQSGGTFEVLAYLEVTFANQYIFANQPPTFAVTLPATVVDPTATYYIAFYDPVTSTWNDAYLGPVSASGDTLTFTTGSTAPFFFAANQEYDFAVLDLPNGNTPPSPTTPAPVDVTGTTLCNASAGCTSSDVDWQQQALFFDTSSQAEPFGISETGVSNFLVVPLPIGSLSPQTDCVTTPVAAAALTASGNPASVTATSTSTTGICKVLVIGDELAGSTFWYSNTSAGITLTGKNRRQ
jgi:hypothetical protein